MQNKLLVFVLVIIILSGLAFKPALAKILSNKLLITDAGYVLDKTLPKNSNKNKKYKSQKYNSCDNSLITVFLAN